MGNISSSTRSRKLLWTYTMKSEKQALDSSCLDRTRILYLWSDIILFYWTVLLIIPEVSWRIIFDYSLQQNLDVQIGKHFREIFCNPNWQDHIWYVLNLKLRIHRKNEHMSSLPLQRDVFFHSNRLHWLIFVWSKLIIKR